MLTIDLKIGTFAVQKDCTVSGGVLVAVERGRYRIDRYATGFSTDDCGPWRNGPEIALFDESEATLNRTANRLVAVGGGRSVTLDRVRR